MVFSTQEFLLFTQELILFTQEILPLLPKKLLTPYSRNLKGPYSLQRHHHHHHPLAPFSSIRQESSTF